MQRTNVPVGNIFGVLNEPDKPKLDTTKERKVASVSKSRQWKIIKEIIVEHINNHKAKMYAEKYPNLSMEEAGKRFLLGAEVIKELDSIITEVETTFDAIAVQPKRP